MMHTSDCVTWLQQQVVAWCTSTLHVKVMLSIMLFINMLVLLAECARGQLGNPQ